MSSTFPRTRKSRRGYAVEQVDEFLEDARRAFNAESGSPDALMAEDVRRTSFALQKGGYSPLHVDAALERLEDAFADREREGAQAQMGQEAWINIARTNAKEIIDRMARPIGKKFRRAGILRDGYDRKQVDKFTDQLSEYFSTGTGVSVEDVRLVAFNPEKGGYSEAQVDYFLDSVIGVMLAVR